MTHIYEHALLLLRISFRENFVVLNCSKTFFYNVNKKISPKRALERSTYRLSQNVIEMSPPLCATCCLQNGEKIILLHSVYELSFLTFQGQALSIFLTYGIYFKNHVLSCYDDIGLTNEVMEIFNDTLWKWIRLKLPCRISRDHLHS